MLSHHLNPLPNCGFLGLPREEAGTHHLEPQVYHEGAEVMLSFAQHTEGSHNVMFYLLQQLNLQDHGGRRSKQRSGVATPWALRLTSFPTQSCPSHTHTHTGVLEPIHIPATFEVLTQTASMKEKGTESDGLASIGISHTVWWEVTWPMTRVMDQVVIVGE